MKRLISLIYAGLILTAPLAANFDDGCVDDIAREQCELITTDYGFYSYILYNGHLYKIHICEHSEYCECKSIE
jgi:hypothetical protein